MREGLERSGREAKYAIPTELLPSLQSKLACSVPFFILVKIQGKTATYLSPAKTLLHP